MEWAPFQAAAAADPEIILPPEPQPIAGGIHCWEAWQALQSCRAWASGMMAFPLPLRWTDVQAWADRHGFGADGAALLHHVIAALDDLWIDHWRRKAEAAQNVRR